MHGLVKKHSLIQRFNDCRNQTSQICANLETEDYVVQPAEFVSPPKWHLGHTTWFFEKFILEEHLENYKVYDDRFNYVFNSYYETAGERVVRTQRGNLSRPTVDRIYEWFLILCRMPCNKF